MSDAAPPAPVPVIESSPGRDAPPRLHPLMAVGLVAGMSLRRMLRGRRLLWSLFIVAFPAGISVLVVSLGAPPTAQEGFFYNAISTIHFVIVVPAVALTFSTAFPWPEAEEGTLTYWFTAPVPRWSIQLGRMLASVVLGSVVLPLSVLAITLPLSPPEEGRIWEIAFAAILATWMAFPAYLAIFGTLSTLLRRGVVLGVIFVLLENSLAFFQGNIERLTMVHYMRSFLWPEVPPHMVRQAKGWFRLHEASEPGNAVLVFAGVALVGTALALLCVHLVEYRAKQAQS